MADTHPLDRPVWNALAERQAEFSVGDDRVRRYVPEIGMFAACARKSPACMTALSEMIAARGLACTVELDIWPPIQGAAVISHAHIVQMMATELTPRDREDGLADNEIVPLGDADVAQMLALAALTQPGPFFARTHRLGEFIGFKQDGKLIAMAGERMKSAESAPTQTIAAEVTPNSCHGSLPIGSWRAAKRPSSTPLPTTSAQ